MDFDKSEVVQELIHYLGKANKKQVDLANYLGKTEGLITRWFNGSTRITGENLSKTCSWLNLDDVNLNKLLDLAVVEWPEKESDYQHYKKDITIPIKVEHKPYIPDPEADSYFELNLGEEVKEEQNNSDSRLVVLPNEFPMSVWAENEDKWHRKLQVKPSQEVLDELLTKKGMHVIVGEPGAGKTTLLRKLGESLLQRNDVVPMFVSLREVSEEGIVAYFEKQKRKFNLKFDATPYINGEIPEGQTVIWLFDGWDELSRKLQKQWKELIEAQSQHTCILTCRNAQYSNDFGKPYYLMGLSPDKQKEFIQRLSEVWKSHPKYKHNFASVTEAWVIELHDKLQSNEQLKRLGGSPLLLTLIVQTNSPLEGIDLPLKRIEFYRKAFKSLILQRDEEVDDWSPEPQKLQDFLAEVSFATNQDGITAEFKVKILHSLCKKYSVDKAEFELLKKTGVIKTTDTEHCQWLHLTFAEWLLAEAWKEHELSLVDAIKQYWQHPDYDEALALYWSSACSEEHTKAINYLVEAGVAPSKKELGKSRSALKVLVCIYSRSGIEHSKEQFKHIWSYFDGLFIRKLALANEKKLDGYFAEKLANDETVDLRWRIAECNTLPNNLVEKLANDEDFFVRWRIVKRDNLTDSLLEKLAGDEDPDVQLGFVYRKNISDHLIQKLACDDNAVKRASITLRYNLPENLIQELANDEDTFVRAGIAERDNLPSNLIEQLANDKDAEIRRNIALHSDLTDPLITKLASDADTDVRGIIALREDLTHPLLEKLANDENEFVRQRVAANHTIPQGLIEQLASDKSPRVRGTIAEQRILPDILIKKLVNDEDKYVRGSIATKNNLDYTLIEKLASDEDSYVRWNISERNGLSDSLLEILASDDNSEVRQTIAEQNNLPDSLLEKLAIDQDSKVRKKIAERNYLPIFLLEKLATDDNPEVRETIAKQNNLPDSLLEKLATDEHLHVRWSSALNPNIYWEWLTN